jgi:Flp pilus assembly protein TadG
MARYMNSSSASRGIILIEMAIVLPLLLLITFAVLEYGWMFTKAGEITNAARHGARIGVRPDSTSDDVSEHVEHLMTAAGFSSEQYDLTMDPSDPDSLDPGETFTVRITVSYTHINLTHFPMPRPAELSAEVTMAKEGPPVGT